MLTKMDGVGNPLTVKDIKALEDALAYPLPESYASFLSKYNGGNPEECCIDFDGKKIGIRSAVVKLMLGISEKSTFDFLSKNMMLKDRLPDGVFIFASTHGGDFFLISLRSDSYGNVYYKDHEYEDHTAFDPKNGLLPESIVFVSESFDDFIARLYDPDEV